MCDSIGVELVDKGVVMRILYSYITVVVRVGAFQATAPAQMQRLFGVFDSAMGGLKMSECAKALACETLVL